jgi:RepB DNA-primase from phage plasmid
VRDRGFYITLQTIRRQVAAMPNELYLIRLIHPVTRASAPGERLWTGTQLSQASIVRFLRCCNHQGFDVYIQPYADRRNAGYILVDLDHSDSDILPTMRANGHEPCVVVQTSPGHCQAWVQVSPIPLDPEVATAIGKQLARAYRGDLASTDWRHLGRLAGFTNQKPTRRQANGSAPWVKLLHAQLGLASHGAALVYAQRLAAPDCCASERSDFHSFHSQAAVSSLTPAAAHKIYQLWLRRLRIPQRFSPPDWSIADKWVAKELLWRRTSATQVEAILRLGSPGFPRRHSNPDDYLRRTLATATLELQRTFPAPTVHHS